MTVKRYDIAEMSGNPWESYRCIEEEEDGGYVRYDDYAALKAELDEARGQVVSLAVENAELKTSQSAIYDYTHHFTNSDDREMWNAMHDIYKLSSPLQTPATDAAIANWQAQGVEKFAEFCRLKGEVRAFNFFNDAALNAEEFAVNLRKGAAV